MLDENIPFV